jgi:hypothetical protein
MKKILTIIITLLVASHHAAAMTPKSFKCEQPLPEFTLAPNSNPSKSELEQLCKCIWSKLPEKGWERRTSEKIRAGDDPGWRGVGFISRFGKAMDACGGRDL